jgi:hypothetical protein
VRKTKLHQNRKNLTQWNRLVSNDS